MRQEAHNSCSPEAELPNEKRACDGLDSEPLMFIFSNHSKTNVHVKPDYVRCDYKKVGLLC